MTTEIIQQDKVQDMTSKKSIFRFIIAVIWVFFLVYQPPLPVSVIYLLTGISIGYIILSLLHEPRIHKSFLRYMAIFGLIVAYLFVVILVNQQSISNFSHVFWIMACIFPSGYAVSRFVRKEPKGFDYLFHVLLCAALIQATIAALAFFMPNVQSNIFDMMIANGLYDDIHITTWGYRIYGYGTSLMYSIPIVQGVIASWAYIYGMKKGNVLYYVASIFVLLTAIINAKISIIVFAYTFLVGYILIKKATYKKVFSVCLIAILGYFVFTTVREYLLQTNTELLDWLEILFDSSAVDEYYISYYTDWSKWILPSGLNSLIGVGAPTDAYGIDSDMGFINDIWLGGFVYLSFSIYVVSRLMRDIKYSVVYSQEWKNFIRYTLFGVFIIADMKGTAFSYSAFMSLFIVITMFGIDFGRKRCGDE